MPKKSKITSRTSLTLSSSDPTPKLKTNMVKSKLARMSSLFFHKARALRHTSALRYNARSPRHRYERAQFTIHFTNEVKKLVPRALLSYISTWKFLRTLEKCKKHSPSARASPHLSRVLKNSRVLI